jgi:hypothetical protein
VRVRKGRESERERESNGENFDAQKIGNMKKKLFSHLTTNRRAGRYHFFGDCQDE